MFPQIELLNTGSELLLGVVQDLHLSWFGRELFSLGLRISRQSTVPDGEAIRGAVLESLSRSDVLIVSGGLGPTSDDVTRDIIAEILGLPLELHLETLEHIQDRIRRRGFTFQPRMERQAMVPHGAVVLHNDHGTAPGLYLRPIEGISGLSPHIFLLPGPPRELQPMAREHVFPLLKKLFPVQNDNECRTYRIVGMGESSIEAMIGLELSRRGDLEVGYCARPDEVDFRLIGSRNVLDEVEPSVLAAAGDCLLTTSDESLESVVVDLLSRYGLTIATAESCTGGLLASRLTDVAGASEVFIEGFVTYSNQSKTNILGVPSDLISQHGAVSEEVVLAMAEGALMKSGASYTIAVTGIAGPGGGSEGKPVGTVWMALASRNGANQVWTEHLVADRLTFKQRVVKSVLNALRRSIVRNNSIVTATPLKSYS